MEASKIGSTSAAVPKARYRGSYAWAWTMRPDDDETAEILAPSEVVDALEKIDQVVAEELAGAETSQALPMVRVVEPVAKEERCVLMSERQHARYVMIETLARKLIAEDTEQHVRVIAEMQLRHMLL